ncbi:hypothetical protein [Streptomyces sp. W16]|uniref:hypothetical protein n=1 Tax=Streptomyces sp. W16 TaxID=3076631 RepID=UPI003FA3AB1D
MSLVSGTATIAWSTIDEFKKVFGIEPVCRVLSGHGLKIATSTCYAADNYGVYGVRKIWRQLHRAGIEAARCTLIGVMPALPGGAAIVGAFAAPWLQRRVPPRLLVLRTLWVWAGGTAALVSPRSPLALGAVVAVTALPEPAFNVVLSSYRYALAPDRLQARTVGAARLVVWGAIPLGSLAAGTLLQVLGARGAFVTYAVFMSAPAALATSVRTTRRAPQVNCPSWSSRCGGECCHAAKSGY